VQAVHLPELALLRAAHTCTITSEMRNNMSGERLGCGAGCFMPLFMSVMSVLWLQRWGENPSLSGPRLPRPDGQLQRSRRRC
jgi:hypothetical protein